MTGGVEGTDEARGATLADKQRGVVAGAGSAMVISLAVGIMAVLYDPFGPLSGALDARLQLAATASLPVVLSLLVTVGWIANTRFFHIEDIDAAAGPVEGEHMRRLKAILANSFEQGVLALATYWAAAVLLPAWLLDGIVFAAASFPVGRILFASGYRKGAGGRALGFELTLAPTVLLLVATVCFAASRLW
ncbi:MAPEG family protein [Altererythrobacter salegens]|uniref:MAPEG family protein n=1 Tax=Croceibacterium salegens TaxID=1737568 RepID=A0A6I4SU54_9SPHN|nr:MAPEG family protein [Croceibacterium salegens]MXO59403.1 MAPEG family protein [Croceibacterium salegens]